jgi:hypothetical protein
VPTHVTQNGYARKLKWISKKFVLLWDEQDQRGWLINGARALLHLVRAALHGDRAGALSSLVAFDPSNLQYMHPNEPDCATWVLSNKANLRQEMYEDDDGLSTDFQEYVTGFYDLLEKMIDHQLQGVNTSGTPGRYTSRSQLEGWDLDDLASERDPIYPRVARLQPSGRSWIELLRSIHGITLVGCRFGEIIRPSHQGCSRWSSLPTGRSYLAVSRADLKEIMTAGRGYPFSTLVRLTDSVIWYIPEKSSVTCRCKDSSDEEHSDIAQVLLPASMASKMAGKGLSLKSDDTEGAVIFGYNSEHTLGTGRRVESHRSPPPNGISARKRHFNPRRMTVVLVKARLHR